MTAVRYQEPYSPNVRGDRYGTMAGYRAHPHRGQDWAPGEVPALAIADGTVEFVEWSDVLGNVVVLRHADGMFSGYCHLATKPNLRHGQAIGRHKSLGANLGQTGTAATGRHLHLTLSSAPRGVYWAPEDQMRDPLKWILAHDEEPAAKPKATTEKPKTTAKHAAATQRASTTARPNEGLGAIAKRTGRDLDDVKRANPGIRPPAYTVAVGQKVWLE